MSFRSIPKDKNLDEITEDDIIEIVKKKVNKSFSKKI